MVVYKTISEYVLRMTVLLRVGNRGSDVKKVQSKLTSLGYSTNGVDGIFGKNTSQSVKNFQKDNNLTVDGVVGSNTWEKLFNEGKKKTSKHKLDMFVKDVSIPHHFENCRLEAYLCSSMVWSIGYGETGKHVYEGLVITQEQADQYFEKRKKQFSNDLNRLISVDLSQHEYDALWSFIYNVGAGAFSKSTLRKKLNSGDKKGAASEFKKWNKSNKKVSKGLTRRRKSEEHLFSTGQVDFFE